MLLMCWRKQLQTYSTSDPPFIDQVPNASHLLVLCVHVLTQWYFLGPMHILADLRGFGYGILIFTRELSLSQAGGFWNLMNLLDIQMVGYAPKDMCHAVNEYASLSNFKEGCAVMVRLIEIVESRV
jgi:hypothetical protein